MVKDAFGYENQTSFNLASGEPNLNFYFWFTPDGLVHVPPWGQGGDFTCSKD